jgi:transposase
MAEALEADWNQVHMLPAQIEDWIGADHPARYIRMFVDELDLVELGFPLYHGGGRGRPPYATRLLLRAWLYGYLSKTRSTRGLEQACKERMGFIWLCGTLTPDHNSLWRFWRDYRKQIKHVFLQTVKVAARMQMIGFVSQAVDGTKIQAVCSSRGGHGKEGLETMLSKVEQTIEALEAEIEEQADGSPLREGLPEALANAQVLRDKIRSAKATLESGEAKYVQPLEPEARRMNTYRSKGNTFAYNAQAMVDAEYQIVTAAKVVTDNHDNAQLDAMIDASEENTKHTSKVTLADGGYSNGDQLEKARAKDREVVMPLPSSCKNRAKKPYHASEFTYDSELNVVICPQGKELQQLSNRHKESAGIKVYRSTRVCKDCPVRAQCTKQKYGRAIEIQAHHEVVEKHRLKMSGDPAKKLYKERSGIVEPLFAWIKIHDQFNRWTVRGLENVEAQWQWVCTSQNLRRIIKVWSAGVTNRPVSQH